MKTIVGLFDDMGEAKQAALELERAGVAHNDISLVANNEGGRYVPTDSTATTASTESTGHAIGDDAKTGAKIGGVAGLLIGLTGLAIPGLGWIAGAGWLMGMILGAGTGAVIGGLVGALTSVGVPEEDATHYHEGVRRGGTLVAVKADDAMAHRVAEILGSNGAVNVDERAAQYRQEGFVPSSVGTTAAATAPTAATATTATTAAAMPTTGTRSAAAPVAATAVNANEAVIPIVEEELAVGKREVQRGGVRVYTHITERPVEEQVTLHEEHVHVERHPVNRVATEADLASALTEQTLNVTERAEEAVVSKQARVVEEVVVGKEATERTETIHDTVRRTDVDVDTIPGQTTTTGTTTSGVTTPGNGVPGVQTGGRNADGSPDTRGLTEKAADAVTGDRTDDKTGKRV
jgi:uncharacterized protein (TIGR02271 family)